VKVVATLLLLAATAGAAPDTIAVPDGAAGVGFDDIQYAPGLKRILVPGGRTGRLVLVDPSTKATAAIAGFSSATSFKGGHAEGTTSAVELDGDAGLVVATDRGSRTLKIVDVKRNAIVGSVKLAATPDYVRVVPNAREVWVTEPSRKQIEVFRAPAGAELSRLANISVADGPESLVIDAARRRAYSHTWTDQTFAIDLETHKLLVSTADAGADVDSIGFGAALGHLCVPAGGSGDLSIFGVSSVGKLTLLGKRATAADAHTVAFDPATRSLFVGAPAHGTVLVIPDPFPSSLE
jgi:hypothetical protein